jgi:hypothetical protein
VGASATDSDGKKVEFLSCGVTTFLFPQNQDLLLVPNIWIADSATTVHTTAHKQGFHMLEKATEGDSIMMGNGLAEKASLVGKIPGTMCNQNRVKLGMAVLSDIIHLPAGQFNLFSLTKTTQQGWILGGDNKEIWLTKSGQRLSFDITIPTPKGMLFAMYICQYTKISGATADAGFIISIQQAHDRLAHPGEEIDTKNGRGAQLEVDAWFTETMRRMYCWQGET